MSEPDLQDTHIRYFSVREASRIVGYSPDYITRIARAGKVNSKKAGARRLIDVDDLKRFQLEASAATRRRQDDLRRERFTDLKHREALMRGIRQEEFILPPASAAFLGAIVLFIGLSVGGCFLLDHVFQQNMPNELRIGSVVAAAAEMASHSLEQGSHAASLIQGLLQSYE